MDRCYFLFLKWSSLSDVKFHAFGVASEKGHGACAYIRTCFPDGAYRGASVTSKSRVVLIKTIALSRLKLIGALLCKKLVSLAKHAIHLNMNDGVFYWTNSQITLAWIKGDHLK